MWGIGGFSVLPQGNYPVLAALSAACLRITPPAVDRWLDILEGHLARPESPRVWAALYRYLEFLHLADHGRAQLFLDRLFDRHPEIIASHEGVLLLNHCQRWISPAYAQSCFDRMAASTSPLAQQGMGELLLLRHAWFPEEPGVAERLQTLLAASKDTAAGQSARLGVAHGVGHLWREPQHRRLTHPFLLQLLADPDTQIQQALAAIFVNGELPPDRYSRELLDALCHHTGQLQREHCDFMVQCFESLVEFAPERVYQVCSILLDMDDGSMGSFASARYLNGEPLVAIAFSLQEQGGAYQTLGTALFERLLESNVAQARALLVDLDNRTCQGAVAVRPPRRQWRRKMRS